MRNTGSDGDADDLLHGRDPREIALSRIESHATDQITGERGMSSLDEQAYYDRLYEEQEAEYWAEQERIWEASLLTEIETKISQNVLDIMEVTN